MRGKVKIGTNDTSCLPCAAGMFADATGQTKCTDCLVGQYASDPGQASCTRCLYGQYQPTVKQGSCTPCAAGMFSDQLEATACEDCAKGRFGNSSGTDSGRGQASCIACGVGTYGDQVKQTAAGAGVGGCKSCEKGKYSSARGATAAAQCNACPAGKRGDPAAVGITSTHCTDCDSGTYQGDAAQTSCADCVSGTFASAAGSVLCTACAAGQFTNLDKQTGCTPCDAGTYTSSARQTVCIDCEKGRFIAATGAAACDACGAGTYGNQIKQTAEGSGTGDGCKHCGKGKFSSAQSAIVEAQCNKCAAGKFSNQTKQIDEAAGCMPCDAGKYSSKEGSTECAACAPGKASESGDIICRDCPAGQYMLPSKTCETCVAGWYSLGSVQTCTQCEPGRYGLLTTTEVRDSCSSCAPGKYSSDIAAVAASSCISCAAGKYSAAQGAMTEKQCNDCPIGRYGLGVDGLTQLANCTTCPAGKKGRGTAQASLVTGCEACNASKSYQDEEGMANCKDLACDAGKYRARNQSIAESPTSSCLACSQPICSICPAGKYSYRGMATCLSCRLNEIAPTEGSVNCTKCRVEETTNGEGGVKCVCGVDKYRANDAARSCKLCSTGMDCSKAGSAVASLKIEAGFWRENNSTASLLQCPVEAACVGSDVLVDGSIGSSSNTTNSSNATICVNGLCLCGQRGPLCAICDENYTRFSANSLCTKCPENLGVSIFFSVLFTLLAAACLWLFLWISRVSRGSSIRPIINAWQTMSIVLLTSDDWPEAVKWVEKFLLHTVNLDIISLASPSCLGVPLNFYRRFALTVSGSAVLVGAPWLFSVRKWWHRKKPRLRFWKAWVKAKEQCLADSILLMLLLYTLGTTQALSHFRCLRVGTTDYLMADFTIECGDATWNGVTFFVTIVILVFSIGAPLGFAYELYKRRDELEDPETVSLLGMLYQTYVKEETRERETVINLCCPCVLFGGVMYLQVECTRHSAYRRLSTLEWTAYLARNTHHTY